MWSRRRAQSEHGFMGLWFARDVWRYINLFWLIDWLIKLANLTIRQQARWRTCDYLQMHLSDDVSETFQRLIDNRIFGTVTTAKTKYNILIHQTALLYDYARYLPITISGSRSMFCFIDITDCLETCVRHPSVCVLPQHTNIRMLWYYGPIPHIS